MTTTGINATAVAGSTYTATIQYGNVSWPNCNVNPSANVTLNILANGVVVSSSASRDWLRARRGLRQLWAGWPGRSCRPSDPIQVVATNFLEGPGTRNSGRCLRLPSPTPLDDAAPSGSAPAAPSGLTATAASSSQINLSWTDNSNNETGFKIDQATDCGFTQNLTTVTVGANVTTYSATGLSASTTYYYRVRATNANGDSANTSHGQRHDARHHSGRSQRSDGNGRLFEPDQSELDGQLEQRDRLQD